MTVERLIAAAAELGPVTLEARAALDPHGFSDGELLAEWAGRAGLAPPRLVCRRALFVLAAPRIWRASSHAGATIGLRYDDALPNPAVHRGHPAPIADPSALDQVSVSVPGVEVADALALRPRRSSPTTRTSSTPRSYRVPIRGCSSVSGPRTDEPRSARGRRSSHGRWASRCPRSNGCHPTAS